MRATRLSPLAEKGWFPDAARDGRFSISAFQRFSVSAFATRRLFYDTVDAPWLRRERWLDATRGTPGHSGMLRAGEIDRFAPLPRWKRMEARRIQPGTLGRRQSPSAPGEDQGCPLETESAAQAAHWAGGGIPTPKCRANSSPLSPKPWPSRNRRESDLS